MIISRTPFRISFVGGGTDLKSYYSKQDGKVLSTTIDKYIYVCVKKPVDIVEYKYRIVWSQLEYKNHISEIAHPIVRETLRFLRIDHPLEIVTFADIPAQTGLGSSSSFTVGLLQALYALHGVNVTKYRLASEAAFIEIEKLGRHIGKQDHFAAAYGNMNIFSFHRNGKVSVEPVFYNIKTKLHIEARLMLFYTAIKRDASEVLKAQSDDAEVNREVLTAMRDLVDRLRDVLMNAEDPVRFATILDESWQMKRSLTDGISNPQIDKYYEMAQQAGGIGGKILGAGGGGFLLLYVEPKDQDSVRRALSPLYQLPFRFDDGGSRITYYDER